MDILWQKKTATIKDIQQALEPERKLARTTVNTLLSRMREKGYVEAQENNFAYEFRPLIDKDQLVRNKLDDLMSTILGGDVAPLASYIARKKGLTPEQIEVLEEMIKPVEEDK